MVANNACETCPITEQVYGEEMIIKKGFLIFLSNADSNYEPPWL